MNPIHVLFADDDDDDQFLIKQIIDEIGITANIIQARNGIEVLHFLESESIVPDIILLDINMPIMDGLSVLEQIRAKKNYLNVRIVLFSTTADPIIVRKAYDLGATLYLCKPNKYEDYLLIMKILLTGIDIPEGKRNLFIWPG